MASILRVRRIWGFQFYSFITVAAAEMPVTPPKAMRLPSWEAREVLCFNLEILFFAFRRNDVDKELSSPGWAFPFGSEGLR